MLYRQTNSNSYINDFSNRFKNFCDKAPVLLSFNTSPKKVSVVVERINQVYEFDWDFSIPVKSFIYGIKQILITKECYPIIYSAEVKEESLSLEEQMELALHKNVDLENLPKTKVVKTTTKFLIDKCIIYKDIAIVKNLDTGDLFRYKLNSSIVFFLNRLNNTKGGFLRKEDLNLSLEEKLILIKERAGEFFFKNSELMNQISPKEE